LPAIEAAFSLHEQIEHPGHEFGRYAAAVVPALEHDVAVFLSRCNDDPAMRLGVLRRVREQVRDDLRDADAIAVDDEALRHVDDELVMLLGENRRRHFHRAAHRLGEVEGFTPQLDRAAAKSGYVQQVVDEARHMPDLAVR
jgi:hypothetical protein